MRSLMLSLILALPLTVHTLLVAPSSQCAVQCGNVLTSTSLSDITCDDADYIYSTGGTTFESCLACELGSTYQDTTTNQTDFQAAIYNLRYTLATCLFGFANNTALASTPCLTSFSCAPLQDAYEFSNLSTTSSTYSYCSSLPSGISGQCTACLQEVGNENYLANFVTVVAAACSLEPSPGSTLSLQGSVFSAAQVNVTIPTPSSSLSYNRSAGALTLGAVVGIVVGSIVFLLTIAGFLIITFGKRRRRRELAARQKASGFAEFQKNQTQQTSGGKGPFGNSPNSMFGGSFFDSPMSTRPLVNRSWGQGTSPVVGNDSEDHIQTFSPYHSHYTSPVSATDSPYHTRDWSRDWSREREKKVAVPENEERGERIEMTDVAIDQKHWPQQSGHGFEGFNTAPVLMHPGPGRTQSNSLSDDEIKKGNIT
ncbi:hypothetical protein BP5796_08496 [Coleophoma crateriformis]|uniref:Uncharacterized protein n=1 Tax=Coleophoma crateriformis TaxID=565419 RepID=A0A3D8R7T8_9HELO|nr:hypothetical protein BP5796_08496 [Coleophoma crateriformis]